MPGRVEIDNVQPVVSCGAYPAKAVVGEVVPVSAAVWREGHDAVAATLVVRYLGPRYPQVTRNPPAQGGAGPGKSRPSAPTPGAAAGQAAAAADGDGPEPYVFHGQFTPDRVGLWTFRVDGWGDPIHTWRHGAWSPSWTPARARPNCPTTCWSARSCSSAPRPGAARPARPAAGSRGTALRTPGDPVTRAALALAPEIDELLTRLSAARSGHPRRAVRRLGGPAAGPLRLLVRVVPALDRRLGRRRQSGARHLRHRRRGAAAHRRRWASTSCTCRRSTRSARCTARAATTPRPPHPETSDRRGRSAATRAATTRCTRAWAPSTTSTTSSPRRATWAWRWPWTWRCSAHRIIRGPATTASGSPNCRTAPSPTRKTRRRNTRTSTRSTSTTTRPASTTKCCAWCGTGWTTASSSFASTTRTPSRPTSGPG